MKVLIEETATKQLVEAEILPATKLGMPLKKDGWQFNWRELARQNKEAMFFKLIRKEAPFEIEGMLMIKLENDEMLAMKNVEVSPSNLGQNGKFDRVAGCLIAYACHKSHELASGNYKGFLTFESKTKLIPLYIKKYKATQALGQKMFITDSNGNKLIEEYLGLNTDDPNF